MVEVAGGLDGDLLELELGGLVVEGLLVFVDLLDALHHFLVAPLFALDVQVVPNKQFSIQNRMENLGMDIVPHVQHFGDQLKFIHVRVKALIYHLQGLILDLLSQNRPVLIIFLLVSCYFFDIYDHQFGANSKQVLDVLRDLTDESAEVVFSNVASSLAVGFAVI